MHPQSTTRIRMCPICQQAFRAKFTNQVCCSYRCAAEKRRRPIEERFWAKVNKTDGCWLWMGSLSRRGYGELNPGTHNGRALLVHRFSYELHYGLIPDGLFVCHHCDNRICVRPEHLFLGTATDNNRDMAQKGRARGGGRVGEQHPKAKLTEVQVRELYKRHLAGEPHRELARAFGISESHLTDIVGGRSWRSLVLIPAPRQGSNRAQPHGSGHYRAKLAETQVAEIRQMYLEGGVTQKQLASHFGVSKTTIRFIVRYKSWKHVS